jgi:hypothetical protein
MNGYSLGESLLVLMKLTILTELLPEQSCLRITVRTDARVDWVMDWGREVSHALERMDADVEVVFPDAPELSLISDDELRRSSRENLGVLLEALERGPIGRG